MQLAPITAALSLFSLALAQNKYHLVLDSDAGTQRLNLELHKCASLDHSVFAYNARIEPSAPQICFFFYEPHCGGDYSKVAPRPEWDFGVLDFEVGSVLCTGGLEGYT